MIGEWKWAIVGNGCGDRFINNSGGDRKKENGRSRSGGWRQRIAVEIRDKNQRRVRKRIEHF
jgi:hypothetical protein